MLRSIPLYGLPARISSADSSRKSRLAGLRLDILCPIGDRPEGGKWGYGDTSYKTDDNLLNIITVYGKYTCTRINFYYHDDSLSICPSLLLIYLLSSPFDYLGNCMLTVVPLFGCRINL
jgi:hypothetical protein